MGRRTMRCPGLLSSGSLALLLLMAVAQLPASAEGGKVIVLTDADFDKQTQDGIWLIEAYSPWCGSSLEWGHGRRLGGGEAGAGTQRRSSQDDSAASAHHCNPPLSTTLHTIMTTLCRQASSFCVDGVGPPREGGGDVSFLSPCTFLYLQPGTGWMC